MKKNINLNKKINNNKGSITSFTLLSMLFFLVVIIAIYASVNNKVQKQQKELNTIQKSYEQEEKINDIYDEKNNNYINSETTTIQVYADTTLKGEVKGAKKNTAGTVYTNIASVKIRILGGTSSKYAYSETADGKKIDLTGNEFTIQATASGKTIYTWIKGENGQYTKYYTAVTVKLTSLQDKTIYVAEGKSTDIGEINGENKGKITYSQIDANYVSMENDKVTGIKAGETTIIATESNGEAQAKITIKIVKLTLEKTKGVTVVGENKKIQVSGINNGTISVKSNDETIAKATVSGTEVTIIPQKAGNTKITITESNAGASIEYEIQVAEVILAPNGGKYTMPTTGKATIKTKVKVENANKIEVAWTSSKLEWKTIENNSETIKNDCEKGTYYLYVRIDNDYLYQSQAFIVGEETIAIAIKTSTTEWTNKDITATITYPDITTSSTRKAGYGTTLANAQTAATKATAPTTSVTVTANGYVYATATDSAGNVITASRQITNIDKEGPTITSVTTGTNTTYADTATIVANDASKIVAYGISKNASTQPTDWISTNKIDLTNVPTKVENGATWARVFYHNCVNGSELFTSEAEALSTNSRYKFSVLSDLENYRNSNGEFEFLLQYPNDTTQYNRWIQTDNPTKVAEPKGDGSETAAGYKAIHIDWAGLSWGGLAKSNNATACLIDGSVGHWMWHYAIGAYARYATGIPSYASTATVVELWARIDNLNQEGKQTINATIGNITENGTYYAWTKDIAGNVSSKEFTVDKVDKTAPTITKLEADNTNWTNQSVNVTVTANDAESGLYTASPYGWNTNQEWKNSATTTVTESGTYTVYVRNAIGNVSSKTITISNIDKTAPTTPVITAKIGSDTGSTYTSGTWTNQPVIITATSTDEQSKINRIEYSYDNVTWKTDWGTDLVTNGNQKSIKGTWNSNYNTTIYVRAVDNVGNVSEVSSIVLRQDKTLPTVTLSPNGGSYAKPTSGNATIKTTITAADAGGSGLKTLQYAWSTSNTTEPTTWTTFTNGATVSKTDCTEGTYYLWTNVYDNATNRAATVKVSGGFVVGTKTITITPSTTAWTNQNITATITYPDITTASTRKAGYGTTLANAQTAATKATAPTTSVTVTANGYVYATATDTAGNVITASRQITNIDKTPPTVTLSPNGGSYAKPTSGNATIKTTITAADAGGSGLKTLQYAWSTSNTTEPTTWTTFTNGATVSKTDCVVGTYYLWTNVYDNAGTRASTVKVSGGFVVGAKTITITPSTTAWTNQNITATITYPDITTASTRKAGYGTTLANAQTAATKATAPTTSVTVTANGYVYATATDSAGNVITASRQITNIDKEGPTKTSAEAKNVTTTGYDLYVYGVQDNGSGVNRVQFPTWTSANGQDDIQANWTTSTAAKGTKQSDGTTWVYHVNVTDHKNEAGLYHTHVYAYDNLGNYEVIAGFEVNVPSVTITYNENYSGGGVSTANKGYNSELGTLSTPTRTGYTFDGWYTQATGGTQITSTTKTPATNTTYYAHWTINSYSIDLNMEVNGTLYGSGYNSRIYVGLKIGGVDKGYIQDYYQKHTYGTTWEIYGLKLDGTTINYKDSGTLGAKDFDLRRYFYTLTLGVNNSSYGSISPTSLIVPNNNTTYSTSGQTLTLSDGRKATATKIDATGYTTTFTGWSSTSGTINKATTVNANFNRVDTTAPTMTTPTISPTGWTNGNVTITAKAIDNGSGIVAYQWSTNSGLTSTSGGWTSITNTKSQITQTYTATGNGTYYFYAKDASGNVGRTSINISNIDKTGPTITSVKAGDNTTFSDTITITAEDSLSGVAAYGISQSATTQPGWISTKKMDLTNIPIKSEYGATWARVFYHDCVNGNELFTSESEALSTNSKYKFSILSSLENYRNSNGQFEFLLQYPNDTTQYNRWIQTDNPVTTTIPDGTGNEKAGGYKAIHIDWTGCAWGGLTKSTYWGSAINGSVGSGMWFYAIGAYDRYELGIPSYDSTASVVELWARVDDLELELKKSTSATIGNLKNSGTYYIWAKDYLGNVTTKEFAFNKVDTKAPTMTTPTISPSGWTTGNVTLTGKAIDTESGIVAYQWSKEPRLTASSEGWIGINNTKSQIAQNYIATENGIYYFYAKDANGNVGVTSIYVSNIDRTAPTLSINTSSTTKSITVTATAADNGSGIYGYRFSKDNGATWTSYQTSPTYTFNYLYGNLGGTSYNVKVEVMDNVGYTATASQTASTSKNTEYYTNTQNDWLCTIEGRGFYKYDSNEAIVGMMYFLNDVGLKLWTAPIIVSTSWDAVRYYTTYDYEVMNSIGSVEYGGITYYYCSDQLWISNTEFSSKFKLINSTSNRFTSMDQAARRLLQLYYND